MRVLWSAPGRAARDETAFRHALATGRRLRAAGERLKDNKLIDAYERAYNLAQAVGADGREPDLPPMRDRLTMARRVLGYVVAGKSSTKTTGTRSTQTTRGRKALATMGRRGAATSNARRWADPDSESAQQTCELPAEANKRRVVQSQGKKFTIAGWFSTGFAETGEWPTVAEAVAELQVSEKNVRRALKAAGISLPRGCRKASEK